MALVTRPTELGMSRKREGTLAIEKLGVVFLHMLRCLSPLEEMCLVSWGTTPLSGNHTEKVGGRQKGTQSPTTSNQMPEAARAPSLNWGLEAQLHPHAALVASLKAGKFTLQVQ